MKISDLMNENAIIFLETENMKDAIKEMVDAAYDAKCIENKEDFLKAILAREEVVSTGIGLGVAIPHAKMKSIKNFFIIVAVIKNGVDWDAIDRKPVRAVFLIGGPDENQGEYLKILAKITLLIKNSEKRESIFASSDAKSVLKVFDKF